MTILFKYSIYFVSTVFAGKLICVQHVLFKYNRILQQTSESYSEAYINTTNGFFMLF